MKIRVVGALLSFATTAFAQEMPVPKIFTGMEGQGRWQMEILEGGGRAGAAKGTKITICTDNLLGSISRREKARAEAGCKQRLLRDTADEAVVESVCNERTSTVSLKREGKSLLMTIDSTGPRGPRNMKMRSTHLGPCREGEGN